MSMQVIMERRWSAMGSSLCLVLAATTAALGPRDGWAARAEPPAATVDQKTVDPLGQGLVVVVDDSMSEGEIVRGWIEERGHAVLGEREQALGPSELIRVAVKGGRFDYRIHVQVRRRGKNVFAQPEPVVCACGSDEMLAQVAEAIAAAAEQLARVAEAERRALELRATVERERLAAEQAERERLAAEQAAAKERGGKGRLGAVGYAGIGMLGLGAASVAVGVALAVRPDDARPEGELVETRSTTPPGIALAVVGSLVLGGGLTMVLIDATRPRRKEPIVVIPALGPGHSGVAMAGRFRGRAGR